MEPVTWALWAGAGTAAGLVTGLLPGMHVNTLTAVAVALPAAAASGDAANLAVAAVAVGAAHAFVQNLPGTYLGVPGDDGALAALPAHQLLLRGRGRHAVRAALDATLGGLVLGLAAAAPLAWLVAWPPAARWLDHAAVPAVALTVALLLALEARRGWRALRWAAAVMAASGALGMVARDLPLRAWLPVPTSPFLPLLGGMFGLAGLLSSLQAGRWPRQDPPGRPGRLGDMALRVPTGLGVAASVFTLLVPGLTSASAAAWAGLGRRETEVRQVALLSAVNSAHLCLALAVLAASGSARTGLALAVDGWTDAAGAGLGARTVGVLLCSVLAAGVVAWRVAGWLDRPYLAAAARLGPRALAAVAGAILVGLTAVLSGWLGLGLLVCATLLGLVPHAAGVRRIHLTGALLVPALAARL